jgi:predicted PurR-regulated permease PerM
MTNGNLPATTGNVPETTGELEMSEWLRKLKENEDHKKEEKVRKYNDVISKFIIILVAVCVVSFIAVAMLAVENNNLYNKNDQLLASYNSLNESKNTQIAKLNNYIFSNRTFNNIQYTINMDPTLPKVNKITFNNNMVQIYFVDGTSKNVYFIDNNMYVTNSSNV